MCVCVCYSVHGYFFFSRSLFVLLFSHALEKGLAELEALSASLSNQVETPTLKSASANGIHFSLPPPPPCAASKPALQPSSSMPPPPPPKLHFKPQAQQMLPVLPPKPVKNSVSCSHAAWKRNYFCVFLLVFLCFHPLFVCSGRLAAGTKTSRAHAAVLSTCRTTASRQVPPQPPRRAAAAATQVAANRCAAFAPIPRSLLPLSRCKSSRQHRQSIRHRSGLSLSPSMTTTACCRPQRTPIAYRFRQSTAVSAQLRA